MNARFFDVKKSKQDAIINAALKIFSQNGYKNASTDVIVKEAGISKGLLFHYFGSKQGLYEFIYDYSVKYMTLELTRTVNKAEKDFFAVQVQVCRAKTRVMKNYPYMEQFISNSRSESDPEALEAIGDLRDVMKHTYNNIYSQTDNTRFMDRLNIVDVIDMIGWMSDGFIRDKFRNPDFNLDDMNEEFEKFLNLLRRHFYRSPGEDMVSIAREEMVERNDDVMEDFRIRATFEERLQAGKNAIFEKNGNGEDDNEASINEESVTGSDDAEDTSNVSGNSQDADSDADNTADKNADENTGSAAENNAGESPDKAFDTTSDETSDDISAAVSTDSSDKSSADAPDDNSDNNSDDSSDNTTDNATDSKTTESNNTDSSSKSSDINKDEDASDDEIAFPSWWLGGGSSEDKNEQTADDDTDISDEKEKNTEPFPVVAQSFGEEPGEISDEKSESNEEANESSNESSNEEAGEKFNEESYNGETAVPELTTGDGASSETDNGALGYMNAGVYGDSYGGMGTYQPAYGSAESYPAGNGEATVPGYGYTGAEYAGTGFTGAGYTGTEYTGSGYAGSGYTEPGYAEPGYAGPGYAGSGYTDQGTSGYGYGSMGAYPAGDGEATIPGYGYAGNGYTGTGYTESGYTGAEYAGTGFTGAGYTGSEYTETGYTGSEYGSGSMNYGYEGTGSEGPGQYRSEDTDPLPPLVTNDSIIPGFNVPDDLLHSTMKNESDEDDDNDDDKDKGKGGSWTRRIIRQIRL